MNKTESQILQVVQENDGVKAVKIAAILGMEKSEVNHYLYSKPLSDHCYVTKPDYCWHAKTTEGSGPRPVGRPTATSQMKTPDPALASLCRYYLDILANEMTSSEPIYQTSYGRSSYAEIA